MRAARWGRLLRCTASLADAMCTLHAARVHAGVAVFKQALTQVTTIYKDKSGKLEEKVR